MFWTLQWHTFGENYWNQGWKRRKIRVVSDVNQENAPPLLLLIREWYVYHIREWYSFQVQRDGVDLFTEMENLTTNVSPPAEITSSVPWSCASVWLSLSAWMDFFVSHFNSMGLKLSCHFGNQQKPKKISMNDQKRAPQTRTQIMSSVKLIGENLKEPWNTDPRAPAVNKMAQFALPNFSSWISGKSQIQFRKCDDCLPGQK